MEIFGLEKMSMVDYDGKVCATIFTGSCNFRCEFCHNSPLVLDFKTLPQIPEEEVLALKKVYSFVKQDANFSTLIEFHQMFQALIEYEYQSLYRLCQCYD